LAYVFYGDVNLLLVRKRSTAPPIQPKEFSLPEDREAAATNRFGYSGR
jgi:hypothetical protein